MPVRWRSRSRALGIWIGMCVLLAAFLVSQPAGAHTQNRYWNTFCEGSGGSTHNNPNSMAATTSMAIPSDNPCKAVKVCIYWSWDPKYLSWGSKCKQTYSYATVNVEQQAQGTQKVYARYSTHYAIPFGGSNWMLFGYIYH